MASISITTGIARHQRQDRHLAGRRRAAVERGEAELLAWAPLPAISAAAYNSISNQLRGSVVGLILVVVGHAEAENRRQSLETVYGVRSYQVPYPYC